MLFSFILSNTLLAIIPIFIGKLIGALTASPINQHQAFEYVGLLIACSVGHASTTRLSEYLYLKLIRPVGFLYETTVFKRVIRQPYPYFVDKFTPAKSPPTSTRWARKPARSSINLCYDYVDGAVRLIVVGVILTTVNWYSGAIFALSIVLMFIIGKHTIRNNTKYEKVSADVQSTKSGKIVDAISNFVNVKSFQSEQAEIATVETEQDKDHRRRQQSLCLGNLLLGVDQFSGESTPMVNDDHIKRVPLLTPPIVAGRAHDVPVCHRPVL